MSIYRTAYENYYKNINNTAKGKKDNNKHFSLGKKADDSIGSKYGINLKYNERITNTLIKRIIRELTGAIILLLFFLGLKYIPLNQVKEMHVKYKQTLEQNFNYNEYIDAFNASQIGNIKGKDLTIGNFTTEDLKIDNLKIKALNFMEYLKNSSNSQN
ncbi:hypothetical protein DIC82_06875 [Clostridium beijerinckii]|nr:hypothetical protein DIC82_06875 [Clostridium beijerinckii]